MRGFAWCAGRLVGNAWFVVFPLVCAASALLAADPPAPTKKVLLVASQPDHPWASHMYEHECKLLGACLEKTPGVRATTSVGWPRDPDQLSGVDQVVGWTLERRDSNGGRSFGTTLGHFHDNFARDDFRRLIVNGILWTAHVEVPAAGADIAVDDRHIKLPPRPAGAK